MTSKAPKRKLYSRKMWGGFSNGRLHIWKGGIVGGIPEPAIFTRRSDARAAYEDVRRIEVRELP